MWTQLSSMDKNKYDIGHDTCSFNIVSYVDLWLLTVIIIFSQWYFIYVTELCCTVRLQPLCWMIWISHQSLLKLCQTHSWWTSRPQWISDDLLPFICWFGVDSCCTQFQSLFVCPNTLSIVIINLLWHSLLTMNMCYGIKKSGQLRLMEENWEIFAGWVVGLASCNQNQKIAQKQDTQFTSILRSYVT